ncbi:hypothetical protein ACFQRB_16585 [Halobaculum litoreum]|uniref:Uncharacterized protein n=1 Tax=Halobaculum litoreum TaxID=3031998 RepID=A0ABD5XVD7_9EURY
MAATFSAPGVNESPGSTVAPRAATATPATTAAAPTGAEPANCWSTTYATPASAAAPVGTPTRTPAAERTYS